MSDDVVQCSLMSVSVGETGPADADSPTFYDILRHRPTCNDMKRQFLLVVKCQIMSVWK